MRTLSAIALASQNAENTDEVWLVRLAIKHANILDGPLRLVNDMQDLSVLPANLFSAAQKLLTGWTASNATAAAYGGAYRVTDASAAAQGNITLNKTGLSTGNITASIRIRKDRVPLATRTAMFHMDDGAGNQTEVFLETDTGNTTSGTTGSGHVASGVIDDGDSWLVYITRTGDAVYNITLYPAQGKNILGAAGNNVAAVGFVDCDRVHIYAGTISDRVKWVAFPFQIDLPGEDQETPSVARLRIDNVDQQIVRAIRGLPSAPLCDLEVVLGSQPEIVEIGFYDLTMRSADYDALYIEGTMTFEQIFTEPLSLEITPARFPGMF